MYVKGNLPVLDGSPAGGEGAAAGVFDSFDIAWEFPASGNGHPGNHSRAIDSENAILAECPAGPPSGPAGHPQESRSPHPRNSPFTTFPLAFRGSPPTNSTALGTL